MPTHKRGHEDADDNHVEASEDIPGPKMLRKNPVEKSSDEQKEPLDDPIAETLCQPASIVPANQTEKLSKLPYELLVEVAVRGKKLEDFTCFRSVSRSFHLNVKEEYFEGPRFRKSLPYLMLPPDSNDDIQRQFYSLVEGESIVASLEVPAFKTNTKMCFESLGWLLTVEVDESMSLLDPFSGTEIPLPHLYTFPGTELITYDKRFLIKKMVLSSRPNETTDFILMIIIGDLSQLAFWRLGDKAWNKIDVEDKEWNKFDVQKTLNDIVYVGGEQFYAVSARGIIWAVNLAAGHVELCDIVSCLAILRVDNTQGQYILNSINGSLLGIKRSRDKKFFLTSEFRVYDIDVNTGLQREIYNLGNMAIFLGRNSSFAVDATAIATASNGGAVIKANHIYFTDDFGEYQRKYFEEGDHWRSFSGGSRFVKGGSVDCGVFNFETGDIEAIYPVKPLLSNVCPAIWITPNLCFLSRTTSKASEDIPRPKKLRKRPVEKSSDEQKEPLDDPWLKKCQASEDIPRPKMLRMKPIEKPSDEQMEQLDDPIAETLCRPARFVPVKQTENLSKLPYELLVEIAMRLKKLEDFTCFRSVSRSFHLNVKEEYFEGLPFRKSLPYLMLPPDSSSSDSNDDIRRQFYSLVEGESIVASLKVPAFKTNTKICFESLGWLLTVEVDGSMSLVDPISNIEIPLPHMYNIPRNELVTYDKRFFITKMVLSSRPNETTDFILMIIIGDCYHLAFWRLGDKAWNMIDDQRRGNFDVMYVGGEQFYASSGMGMIWAINLAAGHVEVRNIMDCTNILRVNTDHGQYILKSINGSLLGITRSRDNKFFLTSEFRVYDIDIKTGESREIYSLGSMAIFLGRNSAFAVDATATASNGGGVIKANHIYFTDDFGDYQRYYFENSDQWRSFAPGESRFAKGGSVDCGVFNFETGDIEAIYPVKPLMSSVCPAMWITPNLYV